MAKPNPLFAALADPTRRAILESLKREGSLAGDIARQFNISWPAISRHLRILKGAGLVWETRDGRSRYYELNQEALFPVQAWVSQFKPAPVRHPTFGGATPSPVGRESIS